MEARIDIGRLVKRLAIIQVRSNGGVNGEGKKLVGSRLFQRELITLGDQLSRESGLRFSFTSI